MTDTSPSNLKITNNMLLPLERLCRKSVHGSTGSLRTDHGTLKINYLGVRPEPSTTFAQVKGERWIVTQSPGGEGITRLFSI